MPGILLDEERELPDRFAGHPGADQRLGAVELVEQHDSVLGVDLRRAGARAREIAEPPERLGELGGGYGRPRSGAFASFSGMTF